MLCLSQSAAVYVNFAVSNTQCNIYTIHEEAIPVQQWRGWVDAFKCRVPICTTSPVPSRQIDTSTEIEQVLLQGHAILEKGKFRRADSELSNKTRKNKLVVIRLQQTDFYIFYLLDEPEIHIVIIKISMAVQNA